MVQNTKLLMAILHYLKQQVIERLHNLATCHVSIALTVLMLSVIFLFQMYHVAIVFLSHLTLLYYYWLLVISQC